MFHCNLCYTCKTACGAEWKYCFFVVKHTMSACVEIMLGTSENIHEDEKKFEKFFSRTRKYFTCPASCEGEWEYGVPGKHTMAGCFEMIGTFWKSVWIFGGKFKLVSSGLGLFLKSHGCSPLAMVDSSTCTWQVQTVVYLSFLPVFDLVLSTMFLIIF